MDDKTETQAAILVVNPDAAARLGVMLSAKFTSYEQYRRLAELKWARNARQYLGIYDTEMESKMDPTKSRAYPKITRVKCVSMLSRLMNLLFPTDDKNWTISASAVPNVSEQDMSAILTQLQSAKQGQDLTNEEIESAIRELAKKRAARLELEIEDQLQELGGNRTSDYVALARKVLNSGVKYGHGILKGPFVTEQTQRTWTKTAQGQYVPKIEKVKRPRYDYVTVWDYYPDLTAKTLEQMEGQFERVVMSKHQVQMLKKRADFLVPQVDEALRKYPTGNYKRRPYETELKAMGVQLNVNDSDANKYEAIIWEGYVQGRDLVECGLELTEEQLKGEARVSIWLIGDIPIKIALDPWSVLLNGETIPMYHHFIFEEDESSLTGNGLPNIMRDSQMSVCAGARMVLDNASIACGLNMEVNLGLLLPNQDTTSIQPNKIWYRDDDQVATATLPAIKPIEIPSRISELQDVVEMFSNFADQETFVNAATGGDMQKGPSEPFRTAAGASMLKGDAALPFKDVVRNFDAFTVSFIGSLIKFNSVFNKNPDIQGDFQPIARGATSLIAKEVLGIQLDNLANTLTEEEKVYVDMHELVKARVRVRDLTVEDIVVSDDKADAIDQVKQQQQQQASEAQAKMIEAQIREILSITLKNISQAGKNTSAAEATTANVIINALEKGVSPNALTATTTGSGDTGANTNAPAGPNAGAGAPIYGPTAGETENGIPAGNGGALTLASGGSPSAGFAPVPVSQTATG